ncbi:MAG: M949_RS01915 family surface polysaccharide biosynthesis protein [Flavobacteriales bacterium]
MEIDGIEETIYQEGFKQNAEVFCFHYKIQNKQFRLEWKLYDKSLKCPMDALAFFIRNSIEITDLNKNGIFEIWTMYSVACKGDVSPNRLLLIMYEGDKKYKIEGTSLIDFIKNEKYGGEIEYLDQFNNEKVLLNHALKKWRKNIKG